MCLIVGLGNPGPKYESTRHNIGFQVADALIRKLNPDKINKTAFKGELYKVGSIFILKPLTYMNLSGESVLPVKNFYNINKVIVAYDEIDLPFGALRIKIGGSPNGHNGLKSLDSFIGKEYYRLRIGVDRPKNKEDVVKYVLQNFSFEQHQALPKLIEHTADAALALCEQELNKVREKYTLKGVVV